MPTWWGESAGKFLEAVIDCLDRNPDTYFVAAESDGHIAGCNRAMAELLVLSPDELHDKSIWALLTASDAAGLYERIKQTETAEPFLLNFVPPSLSPTTLKLQPSSALLRTVCDRGWARAKFVQCL